MIATIVNALAVVVGTLAGVFVGRAIGESFKRVVFSAVGVVSLLIGVSMALETQRFLYLVLSLVTGGLAGTALHIEDRIYGWGERLKRRFTPTAAAVTAVPKGSATGPAGAPLGGAGTAARQHSFAQGFLTATVLYCVGSLTILGSFQAGVEGEYDLLFTKSVMDGFMSILLTAAYGIGVGFAAIPVLVYQGGLTLLSSLVAPWVSPLMLTEISGVGGAMVVMIGLNLLDLRRIKTGDFLPGLVVVALLVLADPWIGAFVL